MEKKELRNKWVVVLEQTRTEIRNTKPQFRFRAWGSKRFIVNCGAGGVWVGMFMRGRSLLVAASAVHRSAPPGSPVLAWIGGLGLRVHLL